MLDVPDLPGALCASGEIGVPDAWYSELAVVQEWAAEVCQLCPVQAECLDWAVEHRERYGVWGGTLARPRRKIIRRGTAERKTA
jgi:WhiB family transcriptional regulator, redox-sensing transcriptional regulator